MKDCYSNKFLYLGIIRRNTGNLRSSYRIIEAENRTLNEFLQHSGITMNQMDSRLENRAEYYERLMAIRRAGDWEGWLKFFLAGVRITAEDAMQRSKTILGLYEDVVHKAAALRRSAIPIAEMLFAHPIITTQGARKHTGLAFDTARQALESLATAGIVKEITGQRRGRIYVFDRYIEILRDAWAASARVA